MARTPSARILPLSVAVLLAPAISAQQQQQRELPDGPGKAVTLKVCSGCHGPLRVLGQAHSYEEWGEIVGKMVEEGAVGSDDEFNTVVDYLAAHFPKQAPGAKINVNRAPAGELESALVLSAKEADAIVKYRDEKGGFHSLEDLKKVPGIDPAKIEAKKERLEFQ